MSINPEAIVIAGYDPAWKALYAREREALREVFADTNAVIEHVGSTAVEGLGAKPIIDMMVGVDSLAEVHSRMHALAGLGYEYMPGYEDDIPERRFFLKPAKQPSRYHLHCVLTDSDFFRDHILFRDRLRSDPDTAGAYLQLKQALAARLGHDRRAYTEAKTDFIQGIISQAMHRA